MAFGVEQKNSWKKQNKKPLQALSLSSTKHVPVESNREMGSTLLYQSQKKEGGGRAEGRLGTRSSRGETTEKYAERNFDYIFHSIVFV